MKRDYNQIKEDKKRCALPENLAIADVKEKLKKYFKLYVSKRRFWRHIRSGEVFLLHN